MGIFRRFDRTLQNLFPNPPNLSRFISFPHISYGLLSLWPIGRKKERGSLHGSSVVGKMDELQGGARASPLFLLRWKASTLQRGGPVRLVPRPVAASSTSSHIVSPSRGAPCVGDHNNDHGRVPCSERLR